jgi:hypothetical protein
LNVSKGYGLHIGLNYVNPAAYGGWDGKLTACIADSKDMAAYAESKGIATTLLHDSRATSNEVLSQLAVMATRLEKGDLFVLTYSGHGGQVSDPREEDGLSETWCLWDRQLIDDEIYAELCKFKKGVRILVLSDSCHSGTVIRAFKPMGEAEVVLPPEATAKKMPHLKQVNDYLERGEMYDRIHREIGDRDLLDEAQATAILVSGCQDNQVSYDGPRNGAFTGAVRTVLAQADAGKRMGYRGFRQRVVRTLGPQQSPNYFTIGPRNRKFELQQPFTV